MLPFLLSPVFKDYLWGGDRLKTEFGKQTELPLVAESWELSAHRDGDNVIASGVLQGLLFSEFVRRHPQLLGTRYAAGSEFPILIKLIDAKKTLSIQVHPGDAYARRVEHEAGKTEMWIILESETDAFVYFGFTREIGPEEARRRIEENTIAEVLRRRPVKAGDVVFIEAGTVHAIGAGILLAEVQQNSNSTYRMYDFGRLGPDGKPRPLHIDKALDVSKLAPVSEDTPGAEKPVPGLGYTSRVLARCPYFSVSRLEVSGRYKDETDGGSFISVLCTGGGGALNCGDQTLALKKGDSVFVPADSGEFSLDGAGQYLLTTL